MEAAEKVKVLQAMYAGALADAVLRMGREGVLEKVTAQKKEEQMLTGAARAKQLGVNTADEVFTKLAEIFGCANWTVSKTEDGTCYQAIATRCMLCAMARKMGADSPCHIYCLDPMNGMIKGIAPNAEFNVNGTLWDGPECSVTVCTPPSAINSI